MSRKVRFTAASLIVFSLTAGSLSAVPLSHPTAFAGRGTDTLTLFVDWMVGLFSGDRPRAKAPRPRQSKMATQLDPDGHH
jgi:hypothetical protein